MSSPSRWRLASMIVRRAGLAAGEPRRVGRQQVEQEEDGEAQEEQEHDHPEDAPDHVADHVVPAFVLATRRLAARGERLAPLPGGHEIGPRSAVVPLTGVTYRSPYGQEP